MQYLFSDFCSLFLKFLHATIFFFLIVHLAAIIFLCEYSGILIVSWFSILNFLVILLLNMNWIVAIVIVIYVCTILMPKLLWLVFISTASCEVTIILNIYTRILFILPFNSLLLFYVYLIIISLYLITNLLSSYRIIFFIDFFICCLQCIFMLPVTSKICTYYFYIINIGIEFA